MVSTTTHYLFTFAPMKKLLLVIACLYILPCMGQKFNGGLVLGAAFTQVDGDVMAGYNKLGLQFGGFVNRKLSKNVKGQMEIGYIGKGSKRGANPDKGIFDYRKISLNYLEVPVVVQLWIEKIKLHLEGGLSYGVLISSKEEDENGETVLVGPFKKNEIGLIAGFCYDFSDRLVGNFRFGYSILPVANKVVILNGRTVGGSYNNSVQVRLNYLLNDPK